MKVSCGIIEMTCNVQQPVIAKYELHQDGTPWELINGNGELTAFVYILDKISYRYNGGLATIRLKARLRDGRLVTSKGVLDAANSDEVIKALSGPKHEFNISNIRVISQRIVAIKDKRVVEPNTPESTIAVMASIDYHISGRRHDYSRLCRDVVVITEDAFYSCDKMLRKITTDDQYIIRTFKECFKEAITEIVQLVGGK